MHVAVNDYAVKLTILRISYFDHIVLMGIFGLFNLMVT